MINNQILYLMSYLYNSVCPMMMDEDRDHLRHYTMSLTICLFRISLHRMIGSRQIYTEWNLILATTLCTVTLWRFVYFEGAKRDRDLLKLKFHPSLSTPISIRSIQRRDHFEDPGLKRIGSSYLHACHSVQLFHGYAGKQSNYCPEA